MENSVKLPSLAFKYFNSLRNESDEPICTYTDLFMTNFVRNPFESRRCNAFKQHYKSTIADDVFYFISKELDINGNICEIFEKYFEIFSKYEKLYSKEFDSNNEDYRDINRMKKTEKNNKKLNMLPIFEQL